MKQLDSYYGDGIVSISLGEESSQKSYTAAQPTVPFVDSPQLSLNLRICASLISKS